MRAAVDEYRPDITNHHIRSHPEAVSHCSRPLSTHPPPVWTARRAQDFCGGALFGDEDGGCAHRSVLCTRAHYQECTAAMARLGEHGAAHRPPAKVRTHKDVGNEQV